MGYVKHDFSKRMNPAYSFGQKLSDLSKYAYMYNCIYNNSELCTKLLMLIVQPVLEVSRQNCQGVLYRFKIVYVSTYRCLCVGMCMSDDVWTLMSICYSSINK